MADTQRQEGDDSAPGGQRSDPDSISAAQLISHHLSNVDDLDPVGWRQLPVFSGLPGLDLPTRVGGGDWPAVDMADLFRRCGRLDAELRDLPGAGHARLLCQSRSRRFDPLLRDVATGHAYCAIAITEPDAGSDLHGIATVAEPVDGGYRLTGVKQHISRLAECTHIVVFARVQRDEPRITAFLVPRDADRIGISASAPMGMTSVSWGSLQLDNVFVPADQRIGGEGEGLALFLKHFSYWRVMMTAVAVGSAQAAIDSAVHRLKSREAFGGPIGRFSHLQLGLAEHTARVRMAWMLVCDAASRIDARDMAVAEAAMAKAEALEITVRAVEWAMNVFGAAGYEGGAGLEKRYRDLAGLRIADGTTDVLRGQVARAMLGDKLYEESLGRKDGSETLSDAPRRLFW